MTHKTIPHTGHYLFDFDGTLVDSMPYWAKAMLKVLDDNGVAYGDDIIRVITPLGLRGTAEHFQFLGLALPTDRILEEMHANLIPMYRDVIIEKPSVASCLRQMRQRGLGLHILTASPHVFLDPCLERTELYELFDNVWSCEDFGTGKTNPQIYVEAAARIGAPLTDITFLDDNINADRAAKLAGMPVIGVFDEAGRDDEQAMRELCDAYIYTFRELEDALI